MRKRGISLWLLALLLVLTACGAKPAAPPASTLAATEPPVVEEITEKTTVTAIVARNSRNTATWWAEFEQSLETAHPEIDLVVRCISWNDIDAVTQECIASGNVPDLLNSDSLLDYQEEGYLLPADQWVSPETYGKFYPELHARASSGGTVWGIPDHVTARALYYNKGLLDAAGVEVPRTWKELTEVCWRVRDLGFDGYPLGLDLTTDEGYATFACYIWNNGSDFRDDQGSWTLNDPKNLEAVEFIGKLVSSRLTNPDPTEQTRYACQTLFGQGKIAMMIAPSSLPAYCAAQGNAVNYGIAPLPANNGSPSVSTVSGNHFMCFADETRTPEELAAITMVVDALYEDSVYTQWVQAEGCLPATMTGNALLGEQDPDMAVWDQILRSLKFYPSHLWQWADVKDGAVSVLQNTIWNGNPWLLLEQFQRKISG